jgi:hypothetical protein
MPEAVYAANFVTHPHVQVTVPPGRGCVVAVGGNADPLAVHSGGLIGGKLGDSPVIVCKLGIAAGKADEGRDLFAGSGLPEAGGAVGGTGNYIFSIGAEGYSVYPI